MSKTPLHLNYTNKEIEKMSINTYFDRDLREYVSTTADYCGCCDCSDPIGYGSTKEESIEELLYQLEEQQS